MSYEGRSPIKDVARSVVLGAAMISPAVLEACAEATNQPPNDPSNGGNPLLVATDGTLAAGSGSAAPAPPNTAVRPRTPPSKEPNMPTRGFSGGSGRARVRA